MRVATLVNGAGRGGAEAARLRRVAGAGVEVTADLEQARAAVRRLVARGVDLLVFAGGDGTVVMGLALLAEACRGLGRPEPALGVLRLGTGNALADALGASGDPAADLAALCAGRGRPAARRLLEVAGLRAPFAGVGVDAQLLEDHAAVGALVGRLPGGGRLGGAARYALSVPLRSVPRFATGARAEVVVRNLGAPAVAVGRDGPTGEVVGAGEVLWTGRCTLAAAATIPSFGFGLRMFAHAGDRPDRFQLRAGDPGLGEVLRRTRAAFAGRYYSPRVRDFLCDRVALEAAEPVAAEAGGELLARTTRLELGLSPPVAFVSVGPPLAPDR